MVDLKAIQGKCRFCNEPIAKYIFVTWTNEKGNAELVHEHCLYLNLPFLNKTKKP
jgi:hypothetical protein